MPEPVNLLMREFLVWISSRPRTYAEAMEAWRSSCPRLTVWEDALAADLIQVARSAVILTPRGRAVLNGAASLAAPQGASRFAPPYRKASGVG